LSREGGEVSKKVFSFATFVFFARPPFVPPELRQTPSDCVIAPPMAQF